MDDVRLGEDKTRNVHYQEEGKFNISLIFAWAEDDDVPTAVKVHVAEIERPNVFAQTSSGLEKTWSTYEEAEDEGKKFASHLLHDWDNWINSR